MMRLHYHYVENTALAQYDKLYQATLMDPMACSATASFTTIVGCEPECWVPAERYVEAMTRSKAEGGHIVTGHVGGGTG